MPKFVSRCFDLQLSAALDDGKRSQVLQQQMIGIQIELSFVTELQQPTGHVVLRCRRTLPACHWESVVGQHLGRVLELPRIKDEPVRVKDSIDLADVICD